MTTAPDRAPQAVTGATLAASARSFLFVPANRPERYAKALATAVGAVIIDLEDAISQGEKAAARDHLATGFAAMAARDRRRILVRVNSAGSEWHLEDLKLLSQLAMLNAGLAGVILPKAESAHDVVQAASLLGAQALNVPLLPMIESGAGVDALAAIAASPQVCRLMFGNLDFQADLGMVCDPDEAELQPVRFAMVLASRRACLAAPVDGVTAATGDVAQVSRDAVRGRRSGFGAKMCIHPSQVAAVNEAYAPTETELAWARRVIDASAATGDGVFTLDGRMVDAPVLRLAQRMLASQGDGGHEQRS